MTNNAKILWGEGLFLRPQHFQHQDSYTDTLARHHNLAANPFAWGVRDLDLDVESLKNGILRFKRISAIFPNGDFFIAPEVDQLPAPQTLQASISDGGTTDFYLSLRYLNSHGGNCTENPAESSQARYLIVQRNAADLFTDAAEAATPSMLTVTWAG